MKEIEQVCVAILFSAIMLAFVGFLEVKYSWGFYLQLRDLLNFLPATVAEFSEIRGGQIRIEATMGGPIPFGYFLALSMGIFLFLKDQLAISIPAIIATFSLISFALYFTGSRGGWLTAIIIVTVYQLLKIRSQRKKLGIILFGLAVLLGLTLTDNLPLYEDTTGNFEYRSQLFYNALDVIGRHPVFGTSNPNEGGALEMMRQGQGIIDIVNTYIQVALHAGIVGFVLFVSIFLVLLKQLFAKYKRSKQREKEVEYITGAILIALVAATLVLIGTVSSVSYIPTYYWSLIALGSAYVQIPPIKQADSKLGISQSVRS